MNEISRLLRLYRLSLLLLFAFCLPRQGLAQAVEGGQIVPRHQPVRPTLQSTTQTNPRGSDIVEPALVEKVSRYDDGRTQTSYIGLAKIPDPRRNEVGATVNRDTETAALIRLGGAWIYDEQGLRKTVSFDDAQREELLVFTPGPHDDVVSRQGVRPLQRQVGELIVFSLRDLYEASTLNPITGGSSGTDDGMPRLALLRMESTYPGGEAVDLAVVLAPFVKAQTVMHPIRIERRDTTIISANLSYVVKEEIHVEMPWTAALVVETGLGRSQSTIDIPATLDAPFSSKATDGTFYLDAIASLRRGDNRWSLRAFGTSAVSDLVATGRDHHQIVLRADARFEHGTRFFLLTELSGEMTDKPHQVLDWDSADYAGSVVMGFGHRSFGSSGYERTRFEVAAGLRMGENRRIEKFETRARSRGLGPQAGAAGEFVQALGSGFEVRAGSGARVYSISGRGPRDEGFSEKGFLLDGSLALGKSLLGVTTYAGITSFWLVKEATFREGGRYYENRRFVAPGISLQTYL